MYSADDAERSAKIVKKTPCLQRVPGFRLDHSNDRHKQTQKDGERGKIWRKGKRIVEDRDCFSSCLTAVVGCKKLEGFPRI